MRPEPLHACLQHQNPEPRRKRAGALRELHVSTGGRGSPERRVGFCRESTQRPKGGTMFGFPKHSKFTSSIPQLIPVVPFPSFLIMHMLLRPQKAVPASWELAGSDRVHSPGQGSLLLKPTRGPTLVGNQLELREHRPSSCKWFTAASWADLSPAAPTRPVCPLCTGVTSNVSSWEELHSGGPDRDHSPKLACVPERPGEGVGEQDQPDVSHLLHVPSQGSCSFLWAAHCYLEALHRMKSNTNKSGFLLSTYMSYQALDLQQL